MQTLGAVEPFKSVAVGPSGAEICQEIARQGERAIRLRLGRLQFDLSLHRASATDATVGVSPELTDSELVRLAKNPTGAYGASWERGLRMQFGGHGGGANRSF